MSRIQLTATFTFWAVAGITFVGCGDVPSPGQSAWLSTRTESPMGNA